MRQIRVLGTVSVALALAAGLTACEPPPPRPVFHAVGAEAGPDAIPGDGVCATAGGGCSLEAAVDEANTHPRARILATGSHPDSNLVVTGDLELWGSAEEWTEASGSEVRVAPGATLRVRDMGVGALRVDGTVTAERVGFGFDVSTRPEPPALDIGPSGTMAGVKVDVMGWIQQAVRNEGRLALRYATIWASNPEFGRPEAAITTTGSGSTSIGATHLLGSDEVEMVPGCAGTPPVSEGWNVAYDSACGLSGPGDRQDLAIVTDTQEPGSPLLDAVPIGTLGCQVEPSDAFGVIQAIDGDEDGVLACDIGQGYER